MTLVCVSLLDVRSMQSRDAGVIGSMGVEGELEEMANFMDVKNVSV